MIGWFIHDAPIKRKLTVTFSLFTGLVAAVTAVSFYEGLKVSGAAAGPMHVVTFTALGLTVLAAVLGGWLNAAISNPYVGTVVRMEALAAGDLDSAIAYQDHHDCVGRMTRAMKAFQDSAVERNRLQRAAGAHQAELDQKLSDAEAAFAASAKDQNAVVEGLAVALASLAAGDLTARFTGEVGGEYRKLRDDFNNAMASMQDAMVVIAANAGGMTSGAMEISRAADDLSRRTEQQAASLEETAAALDEITATVRRTSEGASQARTVVGAAKADAETGGDVVRRAVEAMSEIEGSSNQISQIIGVIDEIAFQTNLLALNAGVEAARAGEAGRGFAVVASEVRALAQRSAEAAKEIKTLISASSAQVGTGVTLVGETGQALERIVAQVAQINTVVAEIAASAQEQSTGLHQVNIAVNQMDQVTQQNAAMVEETTAASHALAKEAGELAQLMTRFRLTSGGAPRMRAAA